jgi:hypothetical protein
MNMSLTAMGWVMVGLTAILLVLVLLALFR